jgi:hypothetical protein
MGLMQKKIRPKLDERLQGFKFVKVRRKLGQNLMKDFKVSNL